MDSELALRQSDSAPSWEKPTSTEPAPSVTASVLSSVCAPQAARSVRATAAAVMI